MQETGSAAVHVVDAAAQLTQQAQVRSAAS
jgi:hypothetical protein